MLNGFGGFIMISDKLVSITKPPQSIPKFDAVSGQVNNSAGVSAVLSIDAQMLSKQIDEKQKDWRDTIGDTGIAVMLVKQVVQFGKEAELLNVKPNSDDPWRLELAEQAASYYLSGGKKPFSELDRKNLSNIAFEGADSYTPVERVAALTALTEMDSKFISASIAANKHRQQNNNDNRPMLALQAKTDLIRLEGMSATEKSMHDFTSESLQARIEILGGSNIHTATYANLKAETRGIIVATEGAQGKPTWCYFSLDILEANDTSLELINRRASAPTENREPLNSSPSGKWLTLYAHISRYRE